MAGPCGSLRLQGNNDSHARVFLCLLSSVSRAWPGVTVMIGCKGVSGRGGRRGVDSALELCCAGGVYAGPDKGARGYMDHVESDKRRVWPRDGPGGCGGGKLKGRRPVERC